MANTIELEVVTPDRQVFSEQVEFFSLRGLGGELGVLPGHIPLFTGVQPGVLKYKRDGGGEGWITVMGGFLDVQPKKATVLADAAERGEEIDALRAQQAKERAEIRISRENQVDAEVDLKRALIRLKAVELAGKIRH
ncbi:MAG: atpC [Cyanobacteria bacterium RYN_339]|nr:atpC [Cyanobacteria bacterium RYN_339]